MNHEVDLSIRQMAESWRIMCSGAPGHAHETHDGIEYIFSGLPVAFFNLVLPTKQGISAEALTSYANDARAWSTDKGVPWTFISTQEALEEGVDAVAILDGCGLTPLMALTGMYAEQVAPLADVPVGLELAVPHDNASCAAILDVNSAAYGMDLAAGQAIMGMPSFWKGHFPVVGLIAGKPVSTASVLMADGCRYVALVATDPDHRRRGYADAAMRRSLEHAAQVHGEQPTVLHASDAGRPVYERMGYKPISTHMIFMEKRFLTGH